MKKYPEQNGTEPFPRHRRHLQYGFGGADVTDDDNSVGMSPLRPTSPTTTNTSKQHVILLQTILDVFGGSSRKRVRFSRLIRERDRYFDLDEGTRKGVVLVIMNMVFNICRIFGKADESALIIDEMNQCLWKSITVRNVLKGMKRSKK